MNRANQAALFQQTNQGLLGIRQSELNYYINLNIAFGTQAALIGGFTYGVFTQNQYNEDTIYSQTFQDIYWVTSAGTIAASVHVIITTMLLQVLGPGLALHGPIGSMTRANDGMREEQKPIIFAFIIMMILFSLSTVLSFWAVMSFYSSIGSTAMFIIAARYWYFYSERIYLRFYWDNEDAKDDFGDHPHHKDSIDLNDLTPQEPQIPEHLRQQKDAHRNGANGGAKGQKDNYYSRKIQKMSKTNKNNNNSFLSRFRWTSTPTASTGNNKRSSNQNINGNSDLMKNLISGEDDDGPSETDSSHFPRNHSIPVPPIVTSNKHIAMEGYLLKRGHPTHIMLQQDSWERRYFVLYDTKQVFYYKSRQEFRSNPKAPIYKRAIFLHDFMIEIFNSEFDLRRDSGVSTYFDSSRMSENDVINAMYGGISNRGMSVTNTNTQSPNGKEKKFKFQITLIPKEFNHINTVKGAVEDVVESERTVSMADDATNKPVSKEQREPWVLRCDTEEELEMWTIIMRELSPDSFRF